MRSVLTPQELAEYWGCGRRTILNLIYSGRLKSFIISDESTTRKHHRLRADDVINFMDGDNFPSKILKNKIKEIKR